jgi:hypothetical protein
MFLQGVLRSADNLACGVVQWTRLRFKGDVSEYAATHCRSVLHEVDCASSEHGCPFQVGQLAFSMCSSWVADAMADWRQRVDSVQCDVIDAS